MAKELVRPISTSDGNRPGLVRPALFTTLAFALPSLGNAKAVHSESHAAFGPVDMGYKLDDFINCTAEGICTDPETSLSAEICATNRILDSSLTEMRAGRWMSS